MSSQDVRLLSAEVEALRASLAALQIRVELLETEGRGEGAEAVRSEAGSSSLRLGTPVSDPSRSAWSRVSGESLGSCIRGRAVESEDRAARIVLAREIGAFLARALSGDHRGSSGRDRLRLRNNLYVVCADHWGQKFNPPLVFRQFAEVRSRCKVGSDCGSSVFVGFPTYWEAKFAVSEAGLELPAQLAHAEVP